MDSLPQRPHGLLKSKLPLWIGAGALLLFVFTINRWISILSLPATVHAGGWDWLPPIYQPLNYLVGLPVRLLPPAWQPFSLNLLSAILAAGTLGLLARSVILMPHDRTREQRHAEPSEHSLLSVPSAWLPPVFAVCLAGLQLTFWEHATSFSGELLDLFVFAFCVWSLLEFRIDQKESRLAWMALLYGLDVPNNVAMIGFFPAFVVAIFWIRGRSFFRAGFILRMIACGSIGLLLYLLLPVLAALGDSTYTFWQILKTNLANQKMFITVAFADRLRLAIVAATTLLPVALIGIRWPSSFGETTAEGEKIAKVGFHVLHLLFLGACSAVMFDPKFSPRLMSFGPPLLPLYFLAALAAGYYLGYFLTVFHPRAVSRFGKRSPVADATRHLIVGVVIAVSVAVPVGLIWKNFPVIRASNGPALREYVDAKIAKLPASGAVVLADEPVNLRLVEAALRGQRRAQDFVFADSRLMFNLQYQRHLAKRHPARWLAAVNDPAMPAVLDSPALMNLLVAVAQSNAVYYLHPSFGYYFEAFQLVPHGMIYELKRYEPGVIAAPPMAEAAIRENAQFWQQLNPSMGEVFKRADPRNITLTWLGKNYAHGLNHWGVELQRAGHTAAAGKLFELAVQLNDDNASATLNLEYNRQLQKGANRPMELTKTVQDRFGKFRTWDAVLSANGPIDEPGIAIRLGQEFVRNSQNRQAAIQFQRVTQLTPDNLEAHLALASVLVEGRFIDDALKVTAGLKARAMELDVAQKSAIAKLEARGSALRGDFTAAERILRAAHRASDKDDSLLDALSQIYLMAGRFNESLAVLDEQLALTPRNVRALLNKGAIAIQLKKYTDALPPLNRALEIDPHNKAALMNRAIALLQTGQYDGALRDYAVLRTAMPTQFGVHYGLGEIAWAKEQFTAALEHYREFLRLAPPNSEETVKVRARVAELEKKTGK